MAAGITAPQRCSRANVLLRQPPSTAATYGQIPVSSGSGGGSLVAGGTGRVSGSTAVMPARIAALGSRPRGTRCAVAGGRVQERKNPGDDLFSRKAALSVSSALESLTSVFGMGTGMASPLESPGFVSSGRGARRHDADPHGTRRAPEEIFDLVGEVRI